MTRGNYQLHQEREKGKVRTETLTKVAIMEGWSLGRRGPPGERRRIHECPDHREDPPPLNQLV